MKDKYVEERFPRWFVFGEYESGNVDVSDGERDVFTNIEREAAARLISARNAYVDSLCLVFQLHPDELYKLKTPS